MDTLGVLSLREYGRMLLGAPDFCASAVLTRGLSDFPNVDLFLEAPDVVAKRFREGRLDCALLPPIEALVSESEDLLSPPSHKVIPGICIAVEGDSLTERIVFESGSKTIENLRADKRLGGILSVARALLAETRGMLPNVADLAEAMLLSGDDVFIQKPDEPKHCIDLGALWRELYDLPLVQFIWVVRRGAPIPELRRILAISLQKGLAELNEIADEYGRAHEIDPAPIRNLLQNVLRFRMGGAEMDSIRKLAKLAAKYDFCPPDAEAPLC